MNQKKSLIFFLTFLIALAPVRITLASESTADVIISEVNWVGSKTSDADEWLELTNLGEEAIDLSGWSIEGAAAKNGTIVLPSGAIIESHSTYLISNYAPTQSTLAVDPAYITAAVSLSNSSLLLVLRDGSGAEIDRAGNGGPPAAGLSGSGGLGGPASMIREGDTWKTADDSQNFDAGVIQYGTPGIADVEFEETTKEIETTEKAEESDPETIDPSDESSTEASVSPETPAASENSEIEIPSESTVNESASEESLESPTDETDEREESEADLSEPVATDELAEEVMIDEVEETPPETSDSPIDEKEDIEPIIYEPGDVVINEIVSNPTEGNEWVEVVNTFDEPIDLDGWKLTEAGGSSVTLSGTVEGDDLALGEFKNRLNNNGDTVTLTDPAGQVIDTVRFGDVEDAIIVAPEKGSSVALDATGELVITMTPTKLAENVITEPEAEGAEAVEEAEEPKESPSVETSKNEGETIDYAEGDLVINELMSNPTSGDEWIELYNPGSPTISLDGWSVVEGSQKKTALSGAIASKKFTVISFSSRLNNNGDIVQLLDPSGNAINEVRFGDWEQSDYDTPEKGQTLARTTDGKYIVTTTATKGTANVITEVEEASNKEETTDEEAETTDTATSTTETDGPTTLQIISLLPNPVGDDATGEYVAIKNIGTETVTLNGWIIKDDKTDFELNGMLAAGTTITLPRSLTKIALNNTSETIELIAPDGNTIDQVTYETSSEGAVYAKSDAGWEWTGEVTQTQSTTISGAGSGTGSIVATGAGSTSVKKKTTSSSSKKKSSSASQTLTGTVIALPDTFGSQIMYINGMELYQYKGLFGTLQIGDVVEVSGTPSTNHGQSRLKISSADAITIIGHEEPVIEIAPLDELTGLVGKLVQISGLVTERNSGRMTIEENGVALPIIAKEKTDLSFSDIPLGAQLTVTGVLTSYDGDLRLLPRGKDDLTIEPETPSETIISPLVNESQPIGMGVWGMILTGLTSAGVIGRGIHSRFLKQA